MKVKHKLVTDDYDTIVLYWLKYLYLKVYRRCSEMDYEIASLHSHSIVNLI